MPKPKIDRFLEQTLLEDELENHGFGHLSVRVHGNHLVIFTKDDNEVVNRVRLTKVSAQYYTLSMANHVGKWEPTPYRGTITEMITLLTKQFRFALAPWPS